MKEIIFVLGLAVFVPPLLMPTVARAEKESTQQLHRNTDIQISSEDLRQPFRGPRP